MKITAKFVHCPNCGHPMIVETATIPGYDPHLLLCGCEHCRYQGYIQLTTRQIEKLSLAMSSYTSTLRIRGI